MKAPVQLDVQWKIMHMPYAFQPCLSMGKYNLSVVLASEHLLLRFEGKQASKQGRCLTYILKGAAIDMSLETRVNTKCNDDS